MTSAYIPWSRSTPRGRRACGSCSATPAISNVFNVTVNFPHRSRKNREHLPPLKRVYDDAFFEEIRGYLPHLEAAVFLGGESFLSKENHRIWDMMLDGGMTIPSHIVTNGTVFNERIVRIISSAPCTVSISLDGATRETVESIRRNARYDDVLANVCRFQEYSDVELSFCLMPQNYHEFADFLALAERLGCDASINAVHHPAEFSMSALSLDKLAAVIDTLEKRSGQVARTLTRHHRIWKLELMRMKRRLEDGGGPPGPMYLSGIAGRMNASVERAANELVPESAQRVLEEWAGQAEVDTAVLDENDVIHCKQGALAGLEHESVDGRPLREVLMMLRERYGEDVDVTRDECGLDSLDRTMEFTNLRGEKTRLRWIVLAASDRTARDFLLAIAGPGSAA